MFAYCLNNPVMRIDPDGFTSMAGWCLRQYRQGITQYLQASDANAAAARYTGVSTSRIGRRSNEGGYPTLIYETAIFSGSGSVSRYRFTIGNEWNAGVIWMSFEQNPTYSTRNRHNFFLAAEMLRVARSVNPSDTAGRTVRGIEQEIRLHYLPHVFGLWQGLRDWGSDVHMGTLAPWGNDRNAWLFEARAWILPFNFPPK